MPQKDLNSFPQLIADLYHEMSWIVFWCLIAGMVAGALSSTYWLVQLQMTAPLPSGRASRGAGGFYLIIPVAAFVGAVCGCAFGVLIELMVDFFRGPEAKKKKVEHRKVKRRHRETQRARREPSTSIQTAPESQNKRDERYRPEK